MTTTLTSASVKDTMTSTSNTGSTGSSAYIPQREKSFTFSKALDQGLAGFLAGAVSTAILHPLDLIKTRFQGILTMNCFDIVNYEKWANIFFVRFPYIWLNALHGSTVDERNQKGAYGLRGTIVGLQTIMKLDGVKGLYRGISANLAGATLSWGLYFWWYSLIKDNWQAHSDNRNNHQQQQQDQAKATASRLSPSQHLLASAIAGAATALCTNPFWLVKTRMCADRAVDKNAYKSLIDGLTKTYRGEGIQGLYKGIVPALFGVSHGALQFMAYEEMKKWWSASAGGDISKLGTFEYTVMAVASKVFATACTYPYQLVRARLQNERGKNVVYQGTLGTIKRVYKFEGIRGFYKGLGPNLIRVLPGTIVTFGVYEGLSKFFRNYAT
ncbi:hypothetical protein HDU76_002396 [Blyttiomyces sp. JEL0837]|nr:hypothetical protein HDU76_002396 [Blyttiomyces sp. JEL0837]